MKLSLNLSKLRNRKDKILVISGGGTRGFYALGVLKGLEDLGFKKDIQEIYGVSAGAIAGAYRSAGYTADEIFEKFIKINLFSLDKINLLTKKSILKSDRFDDMFKKDLPKDFKELSIPLKVGVTNSKKADFLLFNTGRIDKALTASMAIPGIFPPITSGKYTLIDGGITNNFPVDIAKKEHPRKKIIGIYLNKFIENQKIDTLIENLTVSYEILLRASSLKKFKLVDHLFYKNIKIKILDTNKKGMEKLFIEGYKDCLKEFKK